MTFIINNQNGFNSVPIAPRLTALGACSSISGSNSTTAIHVGVPLGNFPSPTRRIVGMLCWVRFAGSGSLASLQSVAFGDSDSNFTITGTVHSESATGNDAAGSSIGVGVVSAIVPSQEMIYMRTTYSLAWSSYNLGSFYALDGLSSDTPYDVTTFTTHANGSSITETISQISNGLVIVGAGNLSSAQNMTFDTLAEDYDAFSSSGSVGLGTASNARTSSGTLTCTATFAASVSARGSMAVSWKL